MESGTRLGPYEIESQLGAGGMGEVYLAQDTRLGRKVAIKVLPEEFAADPERLARFEQEARAAAALNHPHIAAVHDVGAEGSTHYMVQEYLQGQSLRDLLDAGTPGIKRSLALGCEIAEALKAAHRAGIVHRDLKPDNVFVTEDGHAKVLDFGLAKLTEQATGPLNSESMSPTVLGTQAGAIMGTAGYMAPEQVQGEEVDARADVFAFGCVLWEMFTGKRAFAGKSVPHTLHRILDEQPEGHDTEATTELPLRLRWLLDRALAKLPEARAQSAADVLAELRQIATEVDSGTAITEAAARSSAPVAASAPSSGPWKIAVPLAAAGLLLGAAATWFLQPREPSPGVRRGAMFVQEQLHRSAGWPGIAVSPDGRRLGYLAGEGVGDLALWVRGMDQLEGIKLVDYASSVSFSPDGSWVLFRDESYRLRKVPVGGGAPQTVAEDVGSLRGQSWGPDGRIVYAPHNGRRGLLSVSATGGEPRQLTTPEAGEGHRWPHYLPGGDGLVFTRAASGRSVVEYLDLETLEVTPLRDDAAAGRVLPTGHLVWASDDALYAAAFDSSRPALVGAAVPVAEGVLSGNRSAVYSVADNGTLVYLPGSGQGTGSIAWMNAAEPIVTGGNYGAPMLSPDGTRLAYFVYDNTAGSAIWIRDLREGVPTRLTFESGRVSAPRWSADGERIYYVQSVEGGDGGFRQMLVAADGSSAPESPPDAELVWVVAVAPTGDYVVVQRSAESNDLFVLPLTEGAAPLPLAASPANEAWPAVSPDGRWIAYTSNETGTWSVFVRAWPDTGGVRQIPYERSAGHPRWSADGRTLYVRAQGALMSIPVNVRGDALSFGTPAMENSLAGVWAGRQIDGEWMRDYDVGPDGRVVVIRDDSEETAADIEGHAVVVYNWFDEVARLVAEGQ